MAEFKHRLTAPFLSFLSPERARDKLLDKAVEIQRDLAVARNDVEALEKEAADLAADLYLSDEEFMEGAGDGE